MSQILHLIVTKYWFDQIKLHNKRTEYRNKTPYYASRINYAKGKNYKLVCIRNGYQSNAPRMYFEYLGYCETPNCYEVYLGKRKRRRSN